jgi:hypothetical protein
MSPNTPLVGQVWPQGRPQAQRTNRYRLALDPGSYSLVGSNSAVTSDAITPDPYFSSVVLLLDMEGPDGSGIFIDRSSGNKTATLVGSPTIVNTQARQGNTSFFANGGPYLEYSGSSDFTFPGDFTVECWVWGSSPQVTSYPTVFELGYYYDGLLFRPYHSGGGLWINGNPIGDFSTTDLPQQQWNHVAFVRSGSNIVCYINGVSNKTATIGGSINSSSNALRIASSTHTSGQNFKGYIDEFRITKGVARYTGTFTPPSEPFPLV